MSTTFDKFLITAMDRFVWFILMIVMTHLVTEFTLTKGYTRGNRNSMIPINESVILNAIEIPYMIQYPNHNLDLTQQETTNEAQNTAEKTFTLRPLIDSIFEIPLSALNAVNRLVQRLTSNYYSPQTYNYPEKSTLKEKKA